MTRILRLQILPLLGKGLIAQVRGLEGAAMQLGQIGRFVRAEERPGRVLRQSAFADRLHPLHEEIGNPIRRVHVVRAAAVVTGLLAQVEEVLDVGVPKLEVRAKSAGAFAALINRDGDVVRDFQEGNDAARFTVRPVNRRAGPANGRPRAAKPAGPFGKLRKAIPRFGDVFNRVAAIEQVAT